MPDNTLFQTALNKAMALCSRREYCTDDIRNKLNSWGLDSEASDKIIRILITENYINETRYANAFVRDKFNFNKWGRIKISVYLKKRKIPSHLINSALKGIDDELYIKTLKELVSSHRKNIRARNNYELKAKLLRYGLAKGYESNLLYDVLDDLL
jgi:regulatory protein